jgi:hypothetical protein
VTRRDLGMWTGMGNLFNADFSDPFWLLVNSFLRERSSSALESISRSYGISKKSAKITKH